MCVAGTICMREDPRGGEGGGDYPEIAIPSIPSGGGPIKSRNRRLGRDAKAENHPASISLFLCADVSQQCGFDDDDDGDVESRVDRRTSFFASRTLTFFPATATHVAGHVTPSHVTSHVRRHAVCRARSLHK